MMNRIFVSGNRHKFAELRAVFPGLVQVVLDLPEIQAIDSRRVIGAKLAAARAKLTEGALMVEDTALHLRCLNDFPGALVKWLLESVGCKGIFEICERMGDCRARACTVIGYLPDRSEVPIFFEGSIEGTITPPKGDGGFGWDPIFCPEGYSRTLAEMEGAELEAIKMRRLAAVTLARHLSNTDV